MCGLSLSTSIKRHVGCNSNLVYNQKSGLTVHKYQTYLASQLAGTATRGVQCYNKRGILHMILCHCALASGSAVLHSLVARVGVLYNLSIVTVVLMVSTFIIIFIVFNGFKIFFLCSRICEAR